MLRFLDIIMSLGEAYVLYVLILWKLWSIAKHMHEKIEIEQTKIYIYKIYKRPPPLRKFGSEQKLFYIKGHLIIFHGTSVSVWL
jgi:hypothetical protein